MTTTHITAPEIDRVEAWKDTFSGYLADFLRDLDPRYNWDAADYDGAEAPWTAPWTYDSDFLDNDFLRKLAETSPEEAAEAYAERIASDFREAMDNEEDSRAEDLVDWSEEEVEDCLACLRTALDREDNSLVEEELIRLHQAVVTLYHAHKQDTFFDSSYRYVFYLQPSIQRLAEGLVAVAQAIEDSGIIGELNASSPAARDALFIIKKVMEIPEFKPNPCYDAFDEVWVYEWMLPSLVDDVPPESEADRAEVEFFQEQCYDLYGSSEIYPEVDRHGGWMTRIGRPDISRQGLIGDLVKCFVAKHPTTA